MLLCYARTTKQTIAANSFSCTCSCRPAYTYCMVHRGPSWNNRAKLTRVTHSHPLTSHWSHTHTHSLVTGHTLTPTHPLQVTPINNVPFQRIGRTRELSPACLVSCSSLPSPPPCSVGTWPSEVSPLAPASYVSPVVGVVWCGAGHRSVTQHTPEKAD